MLFLSEHFSMWGYFHVGFVSMSIYNCEHYSVTIFPLGFVIKTNKLLLIVLLVLFFLL